jgi:hypothetical protein
MVYSQETSPLLNKVRKVIRTKRLTYNSEKSYLHYILNYIHFDDKRRKTTKNYTHVPNRGGHGVHSRLDG